MQLTSAIYIVVKLLSLKKIHLVIIICNVNVCKSMNSLFVKSKDILPIKLSSEC